jgi:hypothetical protein
MVVMSVGKGTGQNTISPFGINSNDYDTDNTVNESAHTSEQ